MDPFTAVMAVVWAASTIYGAQSASSNANQARRDALARMNTERETARMQATQDRELARMSMANQMSIAREQLIYNSAQSATQQEFQQQQALIAQENISRQEFNAEKLKLDEQRMKDELFYRDALRTQVNADRSKNLRRRDTILTSPLGVIGEGSLTGVRF